MSLILPVVMTINEERFIHCCLTSLSNVFPVVVVADTGSTDRTLEEIEGIKNIYLMKLGRLSMEEIGLLRGKLAQIAKEKFGATHMLHCDSDEIYPSSYLRYILDNPMPDGMLAGYTTGVECAELPNGEIWRYDTDFNRCAIFSVDSKWRGAWPFEVPEAWQPENPETQYHWPRTEPWQNFYHMHHLVRSSRDTDVPGRMEYKSKFSLQTKDDLQPAQFLFRSWEDYRDC